MENPCAAEAADWFVEVLTDLLVFIDNDATTSLEHEFSGKKCYEIL